MQLTPLIAVHMSAAIGAIAIGPFALWARMGSMQRPWLHRAAGYAYVTFMLLAAFTSVFIRDLQLPNLHGFTWIHLLVPVTLTSLCVAFRALMRRDFVTHRITMQILYVSACVIAGGFTLLPSRYLGQLIWHEWLGWL
jgi:uncharacterized membrane protein